ncbi:MAG: 1-acyl-sn-glycerol-3-phosphate acyltransferase [Pseudomonadota bacterium]
MLIIAAPHTSNWDFIYLIAAAFSLGLSVHWIGKASLFRWPLGPILRFMGGVPVDRSRRNNLVASLAEEINASPGCVLVVPPEGTRGRAPHWKSGFYHIAQAARIPMVCGYLDYPRKTAGLGPVIPFDVDETLLMDRLRDFYQGIEGKYPDNFGPVQLKEEV